MSDVVLKYSCPAAVPVGCVAWAPKYLLLKSARAASAPVSAVAASVAEEAAAVALVAALVAEVAAAVADVDASS